MGYRKWKPSRAQREAFKDTMNEIRDFCLVHDIGHSRSYDSYYFYINNTLYRVSNHSIEASNKGAFVDGVQVRELYHETGRDSNTVYIHASKTRIIEIYNNLLQGKQLDGKGRVKQ